VQRVDVREVGLFIIHFQGGIEDGLETGSGCRSGWSLSIGTDGLVGEWETYIRQV
jgi:hypothetical protein